MGLLDYTVSHWGAFFVAALLLNLSPGPDIAYILGQTAKGGKRTGFSAMFGVWTGALVHVVFAVIGLSAIVATSALAFSLVKWIGAVYLIWLGIQALRSNSSAYTQQQPAQGASSSAAYRQGVLLSLIHI